MTRRLGVAILGTGTIAWRFADDMRHSTNARVVAVGARRLDRASALASRVGPGVASGTIEEVSRLGNVDLVYVATSNALHREHAFLAIDAGKAVLVEKPLALNGQDAAAIAQAARSAGVFAMEAMWMRFTPGISRLRAWVGDGCIGTPARLQASTAFLHDGVDSEPGGALLDLGVYPISLALHLLGPATGVTAVGSRRGDGVVVGADLFLQHATATSNLSCGWNVEGPNTAILHGATGAVETQGSMLCPASLRLRGYPASGPPRDVSPRPRAGRFPYGRSLNELLRPFRQRRSPTLYRGSGLHYQVDHVAECMRNGLTESSIMPLVETGRTLDIVEEAMRQIEERAPTTA